MEDNLKQKIEDDLNKRLNWRRPPNKLIDPTWKTTSKKNGRRPQQEIKKNEDNLKKNEGNLKKIIEDDLNKKWRRPQKK